MTSPIARPSHIKVRGHRQRLREQGLRPDREDVRKRAPLPADAGHG